MDYSSQDTTVQLLHNKNSNLGLLVNGKTIHSKYNPQAEAQKLVAQELDINNYWIHIVLTPGLNYLGQELLRQNPLFTLILIHIDADIERLEKENNTYCTNQISRWSTTNQRNLRDFLKMNIPEHSLHGMKFWKYSALSEQIDSEKYFQSEILSVIQEIKANYLTRAYFAKNWLKNLLRNASSLMESKKKRKTISLELTEVQLKAKGKVILILASGPSLEAFSDILRDERHKLFLISLPSSLCFLEYHKIVPDLVISSDGGYWASQHFRDFFPKKGKKQIPIYALAYMSKWPRYSSAILPLAQQSIYENFINPASDLLLPERGTILVTAMDLSQKLSSNSKFILGMDMASRDIQSHVTPHSFDGFLRSHNENRYSCPETIHYNRIFSNSRKTDILKIDGVNWYRSESLQVYWNWLNAHFNQNYADFKPVVHKSPLLDDVDSLNKEEFALELKKTNIINHKKDTQKPESNQILNSFKKSLNISLFQNILRFLASQPVILKMSICILYISTFFSSSFIRSPLSKTDDFSEDIKEALNLLSSFIETQSGATKGMSLDQLRNLLIDLFALESKELLKDLWVILSNHFTNLDKNPSLDDLSFLDHIFKHEYILKLLDGNGSNEIGTSLNRLYQNILDFFRGEAIKYL